MPALRRYLRLAFAAGSATLIGSCSPELIAPTNQISDFISGVTARNGAVVGTVHDGSPPPAASGPASQVSGITTAVNGGSARISLGSSNSFDRVYISSPTMQGYWDIPLPSGSTAEDLILSVGTNVHGGTIPLRYQAEGGGAVGGPAEQSLRIIGVGTGDVQVSIAWTGATDVDLHLFDPSNEEIYFAHKSSASGGQLDLDSNPACQIDNKNNENIVFPAGKAPSGQYHVVVHYYSACGQPRSDWVVTVLEHGQQPQTFTGSFVGAEGSGNPPVDVTTFSY